MIPKPHTVSVVFYVSDIVRTETFYRDTLGITIERMEGAVGLRGPGETQLETDRRLIGQRISRLKREIEAVRRQRALHRRRRMREGVPVVALVGYTNAGKSSLLRALAGAEVLAADTLFATLDPLTRRVGLPGGETVLLGLKSARYYGLADVGARIWELLRVPVSVARICETICAEYDVAPDRCEMDVIQFLDDLAQNELIEVRGGP